MICFDIELNGERYCRAGPADADAPTETPMLPPLAEDRNGTEGGSS